MQRAAQVRTRPPSLGPGEVPLLSAFLPSSVTGGQPGSIGGRRTLGNLFLGLGRRARWSPLVPPRKMSSLSFSSSGCRGLEAATSRPLQPTPSPRGSFLSPESGPASGQRRGCFSETRFLCSLRSIPVCAAGESAGARGPEAPSSSTPQGSRRPLSASLGRPGGRGAPFWVVSSARQSRGATLGPGGIPAARTATFSPACAAGLSCLKSPWNQAEKRSNLRVCVRVCVGAGWE